jgi:hypothetical protein
MAAHRVDLGHQRDVGPRLVRGDRRAHAGETRADHDDIVGSHSLFPLGRTISVKRGEGPLHTPLDRLMLSHAARPTL